MILSIILLIGCVSFIEALFDKFDTWDRLEMQASSQKSYLLFQLLTCRLCIRFWLSVFVYVLLYVFSHVNGLNLTVLIVSNGIIHLTQRK